MAQEEESILIFVTKNDRLSFPMHLILLSFACSMFDSGRDEFLDCVSELLSVVCCMCQLSAQKRIRFVSECTEILLPAARVRALVSYF